LNQVVAVAKAGKLIAQPIPKGRFVGQNLKREPTTKVGMRQQIGSRGRGIHFGPGKRYETVASEFVGCQKKPMLIEWNL